ncbi:MAG: PilZ domain-containing protein [Candidatus Omnitrophica bacterium]|nr:PilZ domain-containing protein [Candidatus Omnitrophota bacterium]
MAPLGNQKNTSSQDSDQRYIPRWEVRNRVLYYLDDEKVPHEGQTKDLSCAGACLCLNQVPASAQRVNMEIFLSEKKVAKLEGQIRWVKRTKDETQVGVSFSNVTIKAQDLILEHAFAISPKNYNNLWFRGWQ